MYSNAQQLGRLWGSKTSGSLLLDRDKAMSIFGLEDVEGKGRPCAVLVGNLVIRISEAPAGKVLVRVKKRA